MDRIKVKNRNTIVIARNPVERILMKLKDFVIKKRTAISYTLIIVLVLAVLGTAAFVFFDRRSHNLLVEYESIMSEHGMEAVETANVIEKLNNFRKKASFGSVYQKATWSIGNLYFEQGKFDEACNILTEFSDGTPYEIYSVLALLKAGCAAEEGGNLDKALGIYKKLEEKHGRSIYADNVFYNLGRLYNLKGDFSQSRKYYNILIADYPSSIFTQSAKKRLFFIEGK